MLKSTPLNTFVGSDEIPTEVGDPDPKAQVLKAVLGALVCTLILIPFFPRFWMILQVSMVLLVHIWQWKFPDKKIGSFISLKNKDDIQNSSTVEETVEKKEDKKTENLETENDTPDVSPIKNADKIKEKHKENLSIVTEIDSNKGGKQNQKVNKRKSRQMVRWKEKKDKQTDAKADIDTFEDVNVRVMGLRIGKAGCTGSGSAEYKLEITTPKGQKWSVWHRYSDVCRLHEMVESALETDRSRRSIFTRIVPSIPKKRRIRIWGASRSLIKRRRGGLEEFFKRVFGEASDVQHRKRALKIPKVREFLNIPQEKRFDFAKRMNKKKERSSTLDRKYSTTHSEWSSDISDDEDNDYIEAM